MKRPLSDRNRDWEQGLKTPEDSPAVSPHAGEINSNEQRAEAHLAHERYDHVQSTMRLGLENLTPQ